MGSSEIVDSGRFTGQKSTFSQTCSLLSQYLKEKGSFGDLRLGINPNFEPNNGIPAKTMNLLPMIEKNNSESPAAKIPVMPSVNLHPGGFGPAFPKDDAQKKAHPMRVVKPEPEKAPMTIFYAGQVLVFNEFPAEKVKEIMLLASKGISSPNAVQTLTTNVVPKPTESAPPPPALVPPPASMVQDNADDLPIASMPRKVSLTRFLEKRKDRITARAPYPVEVVASNKPAESKPWMMGFGAQFPVQMDRH